MARGFPLTMLLKRFEKEPFCFTLLLALSLFSSLAHLSFLPHEDADNCAR
jgi:hypothetical protein